MAQLTENNLQLLDTADLMARAEVIRDAVQAKTISAQQVGQLFCDLIDACGDINKAVRLFLSTNVPEIQADIDSRLAGADDAAAKAAAEIQRSEQTRALVEALVAKLTSQNLNAPERVDINAAPAVVTLTNPVPQKIKAALFPRFGLGSVLFISDHKAVEVTPDGMVRPSLSVVPRSTPSPRLTHRFINRFASKWCPRACASRLPVPSASTAKVISA